MFLTKLQKLNQAMRPQNTINGVRQVVQFRSQHLHMMMFQQQQQGRLANIGNLSRQATLPTIVYRQEAQQVRQFSTGNNQQNNNNKADGEQEEDYSKKFDSLLGKTANPISDAEKQNMEQLKAEKAKMDARQAEQDEIGRQKQAEQKQQDFDDILSGKSPRSSSEKNLQMLFKEFYEQAKETDPTKYVNSAKSSLGSLSTKLEQRRQKMKQMKEDAMNIDKEKPVDKATDKAEETKKQPEQKVDQAEQIDEEMVMLKDAFDLIDQDKSGRISSAELTAVLRALGHNPSEEAIKDILKVVDKDGSGKIEFNEFAAFMKSDQQLFKLKKQNTQTESAEKEQEAEEEEKQPKLSFKERCQAKFASVSDRCKEKFPKAHEKASHCCGVVAEVWQETFPDSNAKTSDRMSKRKERARLAREWEEKQKDMTPEEIEAMEEAIPEWKRSALVVQSDDEEEQQQKKRGLFGKIKGAVGEKINQTQSAQNFYQSEEFKQIQERRKEYNEFKHDLRDQIDASHNPMVQLGSKAIDKVKSDSPMASAIESMQKYDPDFDLEDLRDEAQEIFQEFFCNYLSGNKDYLEMVCGGTAGALCKAQIEQREKEGWKFKYEELLNCSHCDLQGGLIENRIPQFSFHIECQEFDEKVNVKTGERMQIEGMSSSSAIMNNTYRIVLSRHSEPDIEETGHYWEIIEFYKIGESRMIA